MFTIIDIGKRINSEKIFYQKVRERLLVEADRYCILAINIKSFKLVNELFGIEIGDWVLEKICWNLLDKLDDEYIIGHFGADKFYILSRKSNLETCIKIINSIHIALETNMCYTIFFHIGIYEIEEKNLEPSIMCDRAYLALKTIKKERICQVVFYTPKMRESIYLEQMISSQISEKLLESKVHIFLQGIYGKNKRLVGAEALMRWEESSGNLISPQKLIPMLEETGLIIKIDQYIWKKSCEIMADLISKNIDIEFISVNISRVTFSKVDVVEKITQFVNIYHLPSACLKLEITESVVMEDLEKSIYVIEELHNRGFLISLDDFGSGYSSLNVLKDLLVDVIKLDMKFLEKTKNKMRKEIILRSLIEMIKKLNADVVAEGVETKEDFHILYTLGCNLYQGYYFGKPMEYSIFEGDYSSS